MEKVVEIDTGKGMEKVTLRTLKYKDYQRITLLVAPKKVRTSGMENDIDYDAAVKFNEQFIIESIVAPANLKDINNLVELPKPSVDTLLKAAQEVNGVETKEADTTEKK